MHYASCFVICCLPPGALWFTFWYSAVYLVVVSYSLLVVVSWCVDYMCSVAYGSCVDSKRSVACLACALLFCALVLTSWWCSAVYLLVSSNQLAAAYWCSAAYLTTNLLLVFLTINLLCCFSQCQLLLLLLLLLGSLPNWAFLIEMENHPTIMKMEMFWIEIQWVSICLV